MPLNDDCRCSFDCRTFDAAAAAFLAASTSYWPGPGVMSLGAAKRSDLTAAIPKPGNKVREVDNKPVPGHKGNWH